MLDQYGYGFDTIFGLYKKHQTAMIEIEEFISKHSPRYVHGDFFIHRKEVN